MTRFTLDSNILVYAADGRDPARRLSAIGIVEAAAPLDCVLLPQALSEFFSGRSPQADPPGEPSDRFSPRY
jgi:predicted nucleic acid-binding protein